VRTVYFISPLESRNFASRDHEAGERFVTIVFATLLSEKSRRSRGLVRLGGIASFGRECPSAPLHHVSIKYLSITKYG
jgi:hypothetical protein